MHRVVKSMCTVSVVVEGNVQVGGWDERARGG